MYYAYTIDLLLVCTKWVPNESTIQTEWSAADIIVASVAIEQTELDDQEHDFDGAFHFKPQTRRAGTDGLCRTEAEKANPELMKLIQEASIGFAGQQLIACLSIDLVENHRKSQVDFMVSNLFLRSLQADKEKHFTLFVITGLYPQRMQQVWPCPPDTDCSDGLPTNLCPKRPCTDAVAVCSCCQSLSQRFARC